MTAAIEPLAFWLVPAPTEEEIFGRMVHELAGRFDAPIFEPHLTLLGCQMERSRVLRALAKMPANASYALEVEGVFSEEKFTKTLFVRFRLTNELLELRSAIATIIDQSAPEEFDPHLSLLYQSLAPNERKSLAAETNVSLTRVKFQTMKVIAHPALIRSRADVEAWRVIGERELS